MHDILDLAAINLLSPVVLFFALGLLASLARSDLTMPEAIAKGLALYLMLAIGFKGGVAVNAAGLTAAVVLTSLAGIAMGIIIPLFAYWVLRATTRLDPANAGAVAAHYGSISLVTFVAGTEVLAMSAVAYDGYMVAVMALMETPAIIVGLWLAGRGPGAKAHKPGAEFFREVFLNGSVVLLMGAFAIGWITGEAGMASLKPFIDDPFRGLLCLFMLDMGLVAGARLARATELSAGLMAFAFYMPPIGAALGLCFAWGLGLSQGNAALLAILGASASYIAVPAAMRLALPQANPAIYLTLSLALTFPLNLTIGLPLYLWAAERIAG